MSERFDDAHAVAIFLVEEGELDDHYGRIRRPEVAQDLLRRQASRKEMSDTNKYGTWVPTNLPFDQAVIRVRELLKDEGFGVLTEIDVAKTLKEKRGIDFQPYLILGACNPDFPSG